MYKIKHAATRGTALLGVVTLLVGIGSSALPAFASADSLNPLTKRSLTLTSSSPGWSYTDGSGNSTYAPPNSGANGKQTGNMFSFNVSTDSSGDSGGTGQPIKTMSFQYCTTSAGNCIAPGDDASDPGGSDDSTHSDLNVHFPSPSEVASGDFNTVIDSSTGAIKAVPGVTDPLTSAGHPLTTGQYAAHALTSNFVVYYDDAGTWTQSTGWNLSVLNEETTTTTGKDNYIILTNSSGLGIPSDTTIRVDFFGTTNDYITNPGAGAFFVKINTYNQQYAASPTAPQVGISGLEPTSDTNVIDGGVTVANVMNQSIQITTKVLETMEFSVGTVDPDTLDSSNGTSGAPSSFEAAEGLAPSGDSNAHKHSSCDAILTGATPTAAGQDVLQLGDQDTESALSTDNTYSTHSYFRLSSNSSAGATVYYSGHTLSDTEGDQINPIDNGTGAAAVVQHGQSQFGLALDNGANTGGSGTPGSYGAGTDNDYDVDYSQEATFENAADNGDSSVSATTASDNGADGYHVPYLYPLIPESSYAGGVGIVNGTGADLNSNTEFAFDENSDTIPAALATESTSVVDCITGKIRYAANIAATTPAGIYTTKLNYIAAPQY